MKPDEPKDDASVNVPEGWEPCEPKEGPGHVWTGFRLVEGKWLSNGSHSFFSYDPDRTALTRHDIKAIGAVPVRRKKFPPLVVTLVKERDVFAEFLTPAGKANRDDWMRLLWPGTHVRMTLEVLEDCQ